MSALVVDNFAGGGGASTGIEAALGRPIDIAVNHDPMAVAMHQANHPRTLHLCENVWDVDIRDTVRSRDVELGWFSPDCKHFSKAKGGKPVEKRIRGLAWVVLKWAALARPRVIMLENVEEFQDWGPLAKDNRPDRSRRGETFKRWRGQLESLGYAVECRELRACDYGAPTIRKRLFIVARCDGSPIRWPQPSHFAPSRLLGAAAGRPWRTAAECIDWSIPCPSIFARKKPLADATMARIANGIRRYVLEAADPFIVPVTHAGGENRGHGVSDPFKTLTCAHRGEQALVTPYLTRVAHGERDASGKKRGRGEHATDDPLPTATASPEFALLAPYLVQRYGERDGQEPRSQSIEQPLSTIVPTANGAQLVAAFMAQHNSGMTGHEMGEPVSTIVQRGCTQGLVAATLSYQYSSNTCGGNGDPRAPMKTVITGGHAALVYAFLTKYFGIAVGQPVTDPMHTATDKARFGLVTVMVRGEPFIVADIGMRMLEPRELFNAQGFHPDYVIDPLYDGKRFTKTAQIRMVGNSVSPPPAEALVRANMGVTDEAEAVA